MGLVYRTLVNLNYRRFLKRYLVANIILKIAPRVYINERCLLSQKFLENYVTTFCIHLIKQLKYCSNT